MPQVLQVIQQGQLRGAEVFALDLSRALERHGVWHAALFSLLGVNQAYASMSSRSGIPLSTAVPNGHPGGLRLWILRRLIAAIDRTGSQVVQANGAATLKYLVAARHMSRLPWRLVYRAIGVGSFWRRGFHKRTFYRWLLTHTDLVVAVSRAVADDLLQFGGVRSNQLEIIPNGVEPTRIRGDAKDRERIRAELGIAATEFMLLWVGSLTDEKNPFEFIEIVSQCRTQGLPARGAFIGEGNLQSALKDAVYRKGLQRVVHFFSQQETVGPFLAAADLFVLPSRTEGMPAALLEAAMAGLPTVAYAVGGVPEVVEHGVTGILVPPGDSQGLARAVAMLVQDDAVRVRMGSAARERARVHEIDPVASAYRRVYEELLNSHN